MTAALPCPPPPRPAALPRLIQNRNFLLLWAAYFIAAFGDNMNDPAQLSLLGALESDDATRLMALMMFGLFLPYVVLGPLAGWCADRLSRKWTMITADVVRALIVVNFAGLIPLLLRWGFGDYTVMTTQMMLGILAAFFSPARQAMLPTLVRPDQLVRANGMISALAPIGAMLGFLVGGHIVEYIDPRWNFRINSATYSLSALLVLCILVPKHPAAASASRPGATLFGPLAEGFAYVRRHRRVLQMILLGALFWGAAGVVYSCIPAVVKEVVSESYADLGIYRALPSIGMVAGALFMTVVGPAFGIRPAIVSGLGLAALGLAFLAVVFKLKLGAAAAAGSLVVVGLAGAVLLVTINATLQRFVPDSRRGRVFGVSDMATMAAMVLATGALGMAPLEKLDRYVPVILLLTTLALFGSMLIAVRLYRLDGARRKTTRGTSRTRK